MLPNCSFLTTAKYTATASFWTRFILRLDLSKTELCVKRMNEGRNLETRTFFVIMLGSGWVTIPVLRTAQGNTGDFLIIENGTTKLGFDLITTVSNTTISKRIGSDFHITNQTLVTHREFLK
ncbi:hypothetical protein BKA57DRAFT_443055 [Linnemannia elongata]|nr:hypothetical protein BKA57DRAFT_443055 [Linnemannia elongata]